MGDSSQELKQFDALLIDGYLREFEEQTFDTMNNFILSVINEVCMEFYNTVQRDRFDPELVGDGLEIKDEDIVRVCNKNVFSSAYMSNVINKGMYKWKFKVLKIEYRRTNIYIGVCEGNDDSRQRLNGKFSSLMRYGAALNLRCGNLRGGHNQRVGETEYQDNCPPAKEGDIIEMRLNFNQDNTCDLGYIVNGNDHGVAFRFVACNSFRAAVCLT